MIERLERFISAGVPLKTIFRFYYYSIPNIIVLVLPISMLLSALFTSGQLVRKGELTAIKAAGISLYRMFFPVMLFAVIISVFAYWFTENIAAHSEKVKEDIWLYEVRKQRKPSETIRNNLAFQESNNRLIKINEFYGYKNRGYKVNITQLDSNRIVRTQFADSIEFVESNNDWILYSVIDRDFSTGSLIESRTDTLVIHDFYLSQEDIFKLKKKPEFMNRQELSTHMEKLKVMGSEYKYLEVDLMQKVAFPLVNLIVVILGLTLATYKFGGSVAMGFGLCLMITFVYYVVLTFAVDFGHKGYLSPLVAAWFSNVLFSIVGGIALVMAKK